MSTASVHLDRPVLRRSRHPGRLLRAIPRPDIAAARGALRNLTNRLRRPVLYVGAMVSVCQAAWQVAQPLGWLTVAVCLYVLDELLTPDDETG